MIAMLAMIATLFSRAFWVNLTETERVFAPEFP